MHKAKCDKCGDQCEVPFKPTGSKPLFCRDCFKPEDRGDRGGGGRSHRPDRGDRRMYKATCDDCGNRCEVPFRPSGDKPIKCDKCFGKGRSSGRGGGGSDQFEKQFEMLNTKLDKILKLITPTITVDLDEKKTKKTVKKEEEPKKVVKKKVAAKKTVAKKTTKKAATKKKTAAKKKK